MSIVNMIVDRNHVGKTYREVIRDVLACMKPGAFKRLPRETRKQIIRDIVLRHADNRMTYECAMHTRPWN